MKSKKRSLSSIALEHRDLVLKFLDRSKKIKRDDYFLNLFSIIEEGLEDIDILGKKGISNKEVEGYSFYGLG